MVKHRWISLYSYLLFIGMMLAALLLSYVGMLFYFLRGKDPRLGIQQVMRYFFRRYFDWMPLVGSVQVVNAPTDRAVKPAIYVASHQSSIDYALVAAHVRDFATISNHPISKFPLFFGYPRYTGVYYMDPTDPKDSLRVYLVLERMLKRGRNIFLFPEGTRNFGATLKNFQKGAFRLSVATQTPVVPVIIRGTGAIVSKGSNLAKSDRRQNVSLVFLDPVMPEAGEKARDLTRRVRLVMQSYIDEHGYV